MVLFLLTFFLTYGTIHLYLFLKARAALHPSLGWSAALMLFMLVMVLAPVLVRLLDRQALMLPARLLAYLGYTWMGLLFLFFWMSLSLDLYNICMRLLAYLPGSPTARLLWTGKSAFIFLLLASLALGLLATLDAWHIRLERLPLKTAKLVAHREKLTIVQISDLHLGLLVGEKRLRRILYLVRQAEPDLLVCTGDLVDAQMHRFDHLAEMLAEVRPPLGKFAVTGNHEFYAGIEQSERFLKLAGFTLLRGIRQSPEGQFTLVGVDDPASTYRHPNSPPPTQQEATVLSGLNPRTYTVLLKHRPSVVTQSLGRFDLQLSGHTHKGQIFPFNLVTRLYYPKQDGLHNLNGGSLLYVSRGTGTWGPPMRLFAPPHVTLIEITRADSRND